MRHLFPDPRGFARRSLKTIHRSASLDPRGFARRLLKTLPQLAFLDPRGSARRSLKTIHRLASLTPRGSARRSLKTIHRLASLTPRGSARRSLKTIHRLASLTPRGSARRSLKTIHWIVFLAPRGFARRSLKTIHWIVFLALATPAAAQDTDLELVLLADASGSISAAELAFQRMSYAQAITDPRVLDAISNTAYGSIAVTYVEWATTQGVVVPWMRIATEAHAEEFAAALSGPPRGANGRNAIGSALLFGRDLIEGNDIAGWRRVIDFSGDTDGNTYGPPIEQARDEVIAGGITINALAVTAESGRAELPETYERRIIGGDGAFVVEAASSEDFADAVRRKLILEIAGRTPTRILASD